MGETFYSIYVETAGCQIMLLTKVILISLWKERVLKRFLDKMQQMSVGSQVKASCLISVESADSQKTHQWKVILLSLWKMQIPS